MGNKCFSAIKEPSDIRPPPGCTKPPIEIPPLSSINIVKMKGVLLGKEHLTELFKWLACKSLERLEL